MRNCPLHLQGTQFSRWRDTQLELIYVHWWLCHTKGKAVTFKTMKTRTASSSTTPLILNLCPRWRGVVNFTPLPLYPPVESPASREFRKLYGRFGGDKNRFTLQGVQTHWLNWTDMHSVFFVTNLKFRAKDVWTYLVEVKWIDFGCILSLVANVPRRCTVVLHDPLKLHSVCAVTVCGSSQPAGFEREASSRSNFHCLIMVHFCDVTQ